MGFAVTSLIFVVVGVIASFGAGICCNRGPSTNLYVKFSSDFVWGYCCSLLWELFDLTSFIIRISLFIGVLESHNLVK